MINAQTTKRECNAGIENGHRINQPIRTGLTIHLTECVLWPLTFINAFDQLSRSQSHFFLAKDFLISMTFQNLKSNSMIFQAWKTIFENPWLSMTVRTLQHALTCGSKNVDRAGDATECERKVGFEVERDLLQKYRSLKKKIVAFRFFKNRQCRRNWFKKNGIPDRNRQSGNPVNVVT